MAGEGIGRTAAVLAGDDGDVAVREDKTRIRLLNPRVVPAPDGS
jgi:hypothetical protein